MSPGFIKKRFFIGFSLYFIYLVVYFYIVKIQPMSHLTRTEGVVVDLVEVRTSSHKGRSSVSVVPRIEYKVGDDVVPYFKSNEVLFINPDVGDHVTILYNPDLGEEYIYGLFTYWIGVPDLIILVLGAIVLFGLSFFL